MKRWVSSPTHRSGSPIASGLAVEHTLSPPLARLARRHWARRVVDQVGYVDSTQLARVRCTGLFWCWLGVVMISSQVGYTVNRQEFV